MKLHTHKLFNFVAILELRKESQLRLSWHEEYE